MTGSAMDDTARPTALDPRTRRLGIAAMLIVAGLAVFVALIPRIQGTLPDLSAPAPMPRPMVVAILLAQPAVIALIGLVRSSQPLLVVAGMVGIAQSFVAFSGVTLTFLAPSMVLIALGLGARRASARGAIVRDLIASIAIVGLVVSAWVVMLVTSETVCWVAHRGSDGTVDVVRVPLANEQALGPNDVAAGCDGGVPSLPGLAGAATLLVTASAVAWRSPR